MVHKSSKTLILFIGFLFIVGWIIHTFFTTKSCVCSKEKFDNNIPPRPYSGDQGRLSIASSSCPDKLKQTRAGVSAFRTYEDHSITNPHVFPSMAEYLVYAESMKDLYGCAILSPDVDIPPAEYLPPPKPVYPTYAADASPYTNSNRIRGVDPAGYYDWDYTITDEKNRVRQEDQAFSDIPGDKNWGGPQYTEYSLFSGNHAGTTVVTNRPVIKYPTRYGR